MRCWYTQTRDLERKKTPGRTWSLSWSHTSGCTVCQKDMMGEITERYCLAFKNRQTKKEEGGIEDAYQLWSSRRSEAQIYWMFLGKARESCPLYSPSSPNPPPPKPTKNKTETPPHLHTHTSNVRVRIYYRPPTEKKLGDEAFFFNQKIQTCKGQEPVLMRDFNYPNVC